MAIGPPDHKKLPAGSAEILSFQSALHTARGENYLYIIVIPRFTIVSPTATEWKNESVEGYSSHRLSIDWSACFSLSSTVRLYLALTAMIRCANQHQLSRLGGFH